MAIAGCMNPNAVNYNPNATIEDNSCIYLIKDNNDATCRKFTDYVNVQDKSFTLSYSIAGEAWVFFHDYMPDMFIHTRDKLFSSKSSKIFQHHQGAPGVYYDGVAKPFFIDIIFKYNSSYQEAVESRYNDIPFRTERDILVESIEWVTEYLDVNNQDQMFDTLTHISIWNATQHTGRIVLSEIFEDLFAQTRRTKGKWSFNDFRNIVVSKGTQFLFDIFHNYALDVTQTDTSLPWYDKAQIQDKWICVRFEFDNVSGKKVILHETSITAQKTNR